MLVAVALAKLSKIVSAWERSDEKTHQTLSDITLRCLCGVQQMRFLPDLFCLKDWMFENYFIWKFWANDFFFSTFRIVQVDAQRVSTAICFFFGASDIQRCVIQQLPLGSSRYKELVCKVRKSYAFFHEITLLEQSNTGV